MTGSLLHRKDVRSWCLYDWANSAFVTSITGVLLQFYFLDLIPDGQPARIGFGRYHYETSGVALWGYLSSVYMLAAGLVSPVLGAAADRTGGKKRYLAFCVFVGAALTCALSLTSNGQYQLCGLLYVAAAFLWTCGNLFYDSLLTELSNDELELATISSGGYAVGYLGGGLLLAAHFVMVSRPHWFGLSDANQAIRVAFITVGIWWVVFSLPLLRHVRKKRMRRAGAPSGSLVTSSLRGILSTLGELNRFKHLARLLVAFILYNTGIGTFIVVAAVFGKEELGLSTGTLTGCFLMIQFVGFPAAFVFIALARKLGTRGAIFVGLAAYIGVVVFALFAQTATHFWVMGFLVALVQGGTQALSRSLYGSMIPPGRSGEFFGFFSIFAKVGSFMGPLCFALARDITGSTRAAVACLASFFVLGVVVLATVDVKEGQAAARTDCVSGD